ncbi:Endonuclease/exonuclease/phosphatase [Syncephalastrum racemosum]|uniref:CCR4-Not complex 3'-5'-exoribonuclease subunit Ccr4 n=1 Tax=Syncephalastrum racemosum TaxID=13706 RepID=A0A1X2HQZ3_SYNRA|nr:Endonuclease/exonuclease/phosphatase [Syncephalastrum racemosum]
MSYDRDSEAAVNGGYPSMPSHSLQQLYNSTPLSAMARQPRTVSPAPSMPPASSPSVGGYPYAMYSNNSFARYPMAMNMSQKLPHQQQQHQQHQQQQQQQQQQQLQTIVDPSPNPPSLATPNPSSHVARQISYAQISRSGKSPHHHARTAAHVARSTPVTSAVTITDPNNPSKSFSGLVGKAAKHEDDSNRTHPPSAQGQGDVQWSTLDMGGMRLKNITDPVCNYTFLTGLYINHNQLTYLNPALANLVNLKVLDASGNRLTSVPPELGLLVNLKELLLFDNNIATLPNELGTLFQLEMLGLEGNPLQPDIKSILSRDGPSAVIYSLRENAPVGMPPPQREWISIEQQSGLDDRDKISVLCYNTLCQKYATSQAYGYTPSWALTWEYRKELIVDEILSWRADVVCLQELGYGQYEELFKGEFRERGEYESIFYPKSRAKTMSDKERAQVDGCATFFKASKFRLLDHYLLEYNQKALQRADFKKSEDIYNRVMTKDNIAVMTILENKETLARILVANSHIHWDPTFADVKLVQVGMLMDELDKFASRHLASRSADSPSYASTAKLPTIIAGDFNSTPESGVYEFLSKGVVRQDHDDFGDHTYGSYTTEGLAHRLNLKSAYSPIGELPFTNYTPNYKGVLDYVWHSSNTLDVLSLLGPIDQDYLGKVVGFPNAHFPSE